MHETLAKSNTKSLSSLKNSDSNKRIQRFNDRHSTPEEYINIRHIAKDLGIHICDKDHRDSTIIAELF
jgi:hypothetical protein